MCSQKKTFLHWMTLLFCFVAASLFAISLLSWFLTAPLLCSLFECGFCNPSFQLNFGRPFEVHPEDVEPTIAALEDTELHRVPQCFARMLMLCFLYSAVLVVFPPTDWTEKCTNDSPPAAQNVTSLAQTFVGCVVYTCFMNTRTHTHTQICPTPTFIYIYAYCAGAAVATNMDSRLT